MHENLFFLKKNMLVEPEVHCYPLLWQCETVKKWSEYGIF